MDADSSLIIVIMGFSLLLSVFTSVSEVVLSSFRWTRLREMVEEGHKGAQTAQSLLNDPVRFLTTHMVLKAVAFVGIAGSLTQLAQQLGQGWTGIAIAWALSVLLLLLSQTVARARSLRDPESVALRLAGPMRLLSILLSPITMVLRNVGQRVYGSGENGAVDESIFLSEAGLRFLLRMSQPEDAIDEDEIEMIDSILELRSTPVREVMVPRIDIVAISVETPIEEAVETIMEAGHSRIPVYHDTVDNIIGILYAKDLLPILGNGSANQPLTKILRHAYFVPESKKVDELLSEMQMSRVHMALVVDEYGGTAGLVTIEDLVEEIVGEIQDEYDQEEPTIQQISDDEFIFDARVTLNEVHDAIDMELPAEGGDTLGGFIYSELGRVPAIGDEVTYKQICIKVLSISGRRIQQVRVLLLPESEVPTPQHDDSESSISSTSETQ